VAAHETICASLIDDLGSHISVGAFCHGRHCSVREGEMACSNETVRTTFGSMRRILGVRV
jgi:hypothetical protein